MDDVCAFHLAPYATHYVGEQIDGSKRVLLTLLNAIKVKNNLFCKSRYLSPTVQLAG